MSEINIKKLTSKIHEFYLKSGEISEKYKELFKHSNGNILDCLNLKEYEAMNEIANYLIDNYKEIEVKKEV